MPEEEFAEICFLDMFAEEKGIAHFVFLLYIFLFNFSSSFFFLFWYISYFLVRENQEKIRISTDFKK